MQNEHPADAVAPELAHTVLKRIMRMSGVPGPAPHELRRERLLEALHKQRARPLILLVAPAGYGKSTLAATYARDSGAAVAWLTLRTADRDSRRLFTRLADALEVGFESTVSMCQVRRGLVEGAEGIGLARLLLTDLLEAPAGFIMVLDDFHVLGETEEVVNAVDALVRDLPETGQIILTSREPPAISMTRLVGQGAVYALGYEDLRFSTEETRAYRATAGGDESRDQQAEGWIAGILLGGAPRQLGLDGGSLLGKYVEREVLHRLSPIEQGWLEMLSVFDTFTPATVQRVLGPGPWLSRLLGLSERCPFLVAGQDGSFRLHALVHETFLNRLRRSPDDRATQAWCAARELAEEAFDTVGAVRACQELGNISGAVELVHRSATEAAHAGRWAAVLVALELLPTAVRRAHPQVCLIEARALVLTGRPQQAYEAAEAALHHGGRSGDVSVQLGALIELAIITFATDMAAAEDWLAAADHLLRNHDLPTDRHRLFEGRMLGVRGVCATLHGDVSHARGCFESAERLLALLGPSRDLALVQQNFGSFCNRTGDYATAQAALAAAASFWRLTGDRNGLATTETILGELYLRLGNLDAGGAALHDAVTAASSVGAVRMEAYATAALGQWHRASGRLVEAVAAFDTGLELAQEIVERELIANTLVWRAEVALLQHQLSTARDLLALAQAEAQRVGSSPSLAYVDRALGRLHLVDGAGARAVDHFEAALRRAGDSWGPDDRSETLYWLGTAHLNQNHAQQALRFLEQAIAIGEDAELPSLLAGPAAEDPRLLQAGRSLGLGSTLLAEVERLSSTRRPWTGLPSPTPINGAAPHSELPRLEAQLFGSFVLHRDGEHVNTGTRKVDRARELLALLILNPKGLPDELIAEHMWPDMARQRALHNLQMAAYSLRDDLGSKAAIRFGAHTYQLNPQLELIADVRAFDAALARARGAAGDMLIQSLTRAVELYRGPLLADAAWQWLEPVRLTYQTRFVTAALKLADALAPTDPLRSDGLAEQVLAVAPDTDVAYERLLQNAQQQRDQMAVRRIVKRYELAAVQFGFEIHRYFTQPQRRASGGRATG